MVFSPYIYIYISADEQVFLTANPERTSVIWWWRDQCVCSHPQELHFHGFPETQECCRETSQAPTRDRVTSGMVMWAQKDRESSPIFLAPMSSCMPTREVFSFTFMPRKARKFHERGMCHTLHHRDLLTPPHATPDNGIGAGSIA